MEKLEKTLKKLEKNGQNFVRWGGGLNPYLGLGLRLGEWDAGID